MIFVNCPPHYDVGAVSSILSVSLRSSFVDMLSVRGQSSSISSLAIRTRVFNQAVDDREDFSTPAEVGESKSCETANARNCFPHAWSRQYCDSFSGVSGYITFTSAVFVITLAAQCRILKSLHCWPKFLNANRSTEESRSPAFEAGLAARSRKYMSAVLC